MIDRSSGLAIGRKPIWKQVRSGKKKRKAAVELLHMKEPHDVFEGNRGSSLLDQKLERIGDGPKFPDTDDVPLKVGDRNSWLEFTKLAEGKPVTRTIGPEFGEGKWPIRVDHPFVLVIGGFAVHAFNEVRKMHVKKDNSNNLCHHQIMVCKYLNLGYRYCFFMIMEVIEEGILGVYKVVVGCDARDGSRTLVEFRLSDRTPNGNIARALPHLIHLKSRYKIMKGLKRDLDISLEARKKSMKGKKNKGVVADEVIRLKEQHKTMKGLCKVLYWHIQSQIPKTWNQRSDPDSWSLLNYYPSCGLVERSDNATCMGYDYHSWHPDYAIFAYRNRCV